MTSDVYCSRVVPRSASSHSAHCSVQPPAHLLRRHLRIFPPAAARPARPQTSASPGTTSGAASTPRSSAPRNAGNPLALPTRKQCSTFQRRKPTRSTQPPTGLRRHAGHEVLLLPRPHVARPDQPVGRRSPPPAQPHRRRLRLPHLLPHRLPGQPKRRQGCPWKAGLCRTRLSARWPACPGRGVAVQAAKRLGHLADVTQVLPVQSASGSRACCRTPRRRSASPG